MAITIETKPRVTTPAYNPVVWWASSTNLAEDGFNFIFDVYDGGSTKIAEYRVDPRIGDSFGVKDLTRLLQAQVSPDLDLANSTYYDATGQYFEYAVHVGEEYRVSYAYTGFTQSGDYVQLTGVGTHSFVVGDQIDITETVATNDLIGGLHTVLAQTASTLTIDVIYDDMISPSSTAGSVVYADGRKSITRDLSINSSYYVTNSALSFKTRQNFLDTTYHLLGSSSKFMCNFPDNYHITDTQELIVQYMPQTTSTRRMYFENSDGDTMYKDVTPGAGEWVNLCGVAGASLGTLTVVSGSLPLVKSTTDWYEFTYVDNTNTAVSETKRVYIDRRCIQEEFEILFMDRFGSWGSFNFMLKTQESEKIKREVYNKNVDGIDTAGVWEYDTIAKGKTVHSVEIDKTLILNTNWMTQEMNEYFAELVSSPETYIYIDREYYACVIKDNTSEITRQRGKNLIKKTITIELSGKDKVNG